MRSLYYNKSAADGSASGCRAELWIVQLGIFLNYLGWGAVLPFEVIYLHDGRGFSLGVAGPGRRRSSPASPSSPRRRRPAHRPRRRPDDGRRRRAGARRRVRRPGARAHAGAGVRRGRRRRGRQRRAAPEPVRADRLARAAGAAPPRDGRLAGRQQPRRRPRRRARRPGRRVRPERLRRALPRQRAHLPPLRRDPRRSSCARTPGPSRSRAATAWSSATGPFVRLAVTNIAMIAVGWGVFTWIVPPYAHSELGAGSQLIGFLLFANAFTVVLAQIPVARLAEGRRRAVTMAVGGADLRRRLPARRRAPARRRGRRLRRRCSSPRSSSASASASTRRR